MAAGRPVFKPYNQQQILAIPSALEELVPKAQHEASFGKVPEVLTADAGYGSEKNYILTEQKKPVVFVKYSLFDKQQNENYNSKHPFATDKLFYNKEQNCYICPMGQQMNFIGTSIKRTSTGFKQTLKRYRPETVSPVR